MKFTLLYCIVFLSAFSAGRGNGAAVPYSEQTYRQFCTVCHGQEPYRDKILTGKGSPQVCFHNSHVLLGRQRYKEALPLILHNIREAARNRQDTLLYFSYLMQASIYHRNQLDAEAIPVLQAARAIGEARKLPMLTRICCDLGSIFIQQKEYEKALAAYQPLEKDLSSLQDRGLEKTVCNNLAIIYLYLENYRQSEAYHLRSLAIEKAEKDTAGIATSYLNLGDLYFEQYNDRKAIQYIQAGLQLATAADLPLIRQNAFYNLSLAEESQRNYKKALDYHKQYVALREDNWNRDKVWELAQQEKKYAVSLKQKEIASLQQQTALQAAELRGKRLQRNVFLITAIGLLLVAGIVLYAYRQNRAAGIIIASQKKRLEELMQTKDQFFSIVAHDLRSPVYTMQLLHTGISECVITGTHDRLADQVGEMGYTLQGFRLLLDNLLQWVWVHTDRLHFNSERLHLLSVVNIVLYDFTTVMQRKDISCSCLVPADLFIEADMESVKIILRNIISNAIKHTQQGTVTIEAIPGQLSSCIQVSDTGRGIAREHLPFIFDFKRETLARGTAGEPATGMGLWLCRNLAEKNNGYINIQSKEHHGTIVSIHLPTSGPYHAGNEYSDRGRSPEGSADTKTAVVKKRVQGNRHRRYPSHGA
ncbi:tetratricopeptide repeat-containing sensor histidine kinase [Chitinophaga tropicalis]|uniref:histidine kinase n=1 Tax=Chitinophaga tropicalis TaxID=2683588 RepID=A0A7K1U3U2_9BACT|nr:ATP-binding protein [Chitinophaga tropicalis]MVT09000.1 tetratricopeptide repeat protein [Chitinophaga tropicalis]